MLTVNSQRKRMQCWEIFKILMSTAGKSSSVRSCTTCAQTQQSNWANKCTEGTSHRANRTLWINRGIFNQRASSTSIHLKLRQCQSED